jgi:hypothetical protein
MTEGAVAAPFVFARREIPGVQAILQGVVEKFGGCRQKGGRPEAVV